MSIVAVFLDASYFLAIYNENDVHHKKSRALAEKIDANEYGQAVTSDYIFDEAVSVTLRKFGKEKAQALGKQILGSIFMVQCGRHIFDTAFRIFNSSKDAFSFTDCVSQAIMDLAEIKLIATFDKMFEKLDVEVLN